MKKATLLELPSEIRSLIWEYAFGSADIDLYYQLGTGDTIFGSDCSECEECTKTTHATRSTFEPVVRSGTTTKTIPRLAWGYLQQLESLLACKSIYSEAIGLFQSTLTFHIKSSEILAFMRSFAPLQLRQRVTKIVLYIHFQNQNEMAWYNRLVELNRILPGLRHIAINYHMRPPTSYSELADAIYMSMPLFALDPPFNKPLYVVTEHNRSKHCLRCIDGQLIPSTDPRQGLSIHTAYKERDILFSSEFLGDVTTDDVIDEHTSVVRALFDDENYIAASNLFLASDTYHRPWRNYPPWKIPRTEVPGELINIRGGRALHDALVQVSHRFEKPWFEKLQRRRILELYMEHASMTREEAEELMERQIASMGEDGIAGLLEMLTEDGGDILVTAHAED